MRKLIIFFIVTMGMVTHAQVAINSDGSNPDNSAMLDVNSAGKGLLIPRVALTGTLDVATIVSPATSLLIYNTATAGTSPDNVTPGYYYWNGTAWTTLANSPWTVNGNDIYSNITGNAGIGTTTPDDKLHLFDSVNLRILIETPDNFYAGVRTRNSQREYFMGTIGNRWSVFDNYVGGERISVLPDGNVGIATTTPDPSALLDVSSTTKGLLPPRMTAVQRNSIATPAEGLVIFNSDEKALNVYNGTAWASVQPVPPFECGFSITINHRMAGGVAPRNKSVTYGTVEDFLPAYNSPKCWITSNLGASRQATAVSDATESSAGWYWQFNRKEGSYHDGFLFLPIHWETSINENADWQPANDPCNIELGSGWRLPTGSEWNALNTGYYWNNWNDAFNKGLALHAAGFLNFSNALLSERGSRGAFWSSSQFSSNGSESFSITSSSNNIGTSNKTYGFSVRCIRDY